MPSTNPNIHPRVNLEGIVTNYVENAIIADDVIGTNRPNMYEDITMPEEDGTVVIRLSGYDSLRIFAAKDRQEVCKRICEARGFAEGKCFFVRPEGSMYWILSGKRK